MPSRPEDTPFEWDDRLELLLQHQELCDYAAHIFRLTILRLHMDYLKTYASECRNLGSPCDIIIESLQNMIAQVESLLPHIPITEIKFDRMQFYVSAWKMYADLSCSVGLFQVVD